MKQFCKYHPGTPAQWYCPRDGIAFCDDCVGGEADRARSLLNNRALEPVETLLARTPFWRVLPFFLRYPFAPAAWLVLALAALPLVLLNVHPLGWVVAALLWLLPLRYAALALLTLTRGQLQAPALPVLTSQEGWGLTTSLALLCAALIGIPLALAWQFNAWAALAAVAGLMLVVPSLLLESLRRAHLLAAMQGLHRPGLVLGRQWLALTLAAQLLGVLTLAAVWMLADLLPAWLAAPLAGYVTGAAVLMLVALVGYLACQWQDELDIPTPARERLQRRRRNRRPEEERRLAVLLREGRYDKVRTLLLARLDKQPQALALHESLMQLLLAMGERDAALRHAGGWLQALLKHGQGFRVPDVMRQLRALDEKFRPEDPALCAELAALLRENGQGRQALWLLQDLHLRAPDWPGLLDAYLLLARILAADMQLPAKAEQFIRFVEGKFRQPPQRAQARACREALGLLPAGG